MEKLVKRAAEDFISVRESLRRAAEVRKKRYDVEVTNQLKLEPGKLVSYFYPRRFSGKSPEWQKLYAGPYTVIRVIEAHVVAIGRSPLSKVTLRQTENCSARSRFSEFYKPA